MLNGFRDNDNVNFDVFLESEIGSIFNENLMIIYTFDTVSFWRGVHGPIEQSRGLILPLARPDVVCEVLKTFKSFRERRERPFGLGVLCGFRGPPDEPRPLAFTENLPRASVVPEISKKNL